MDNKNNLVFYPFAYVLLDDYVNEFCWYCLNESGDDENEKAKRLLRCSGCKTAYFCSKECQSIGWSDHKAECKAMAKLDDRQIIPDVEVRMLGRLTWRYKQILDGKDKEKNFYLNRTSTRNIMDLCSHDEDMRADDNARKKFLQILNGLKSFYDAKFVLDDEIIFQLHCRNFINRHGISDRTFLREIGKGLYLDLCWYDHSCRPNSIYIHGGFVAILRPLASNVVLSDRSKTFYTYIDLMQSKEERRRCISDSWYFDCQCDRCIDESDHTLTAVKCASCQSPVNVFQGRQTGSCIVCTKCGQQLDENRLKDGIIAMQHLNDVINKDESAPPSPSDEALHEIDGLLHQYSEILPPCNIYMVRLMRTAIFCTDPNDVERMLRYHLSALDAMRLCYPANHPSLAYHLMNIGLFHGQMNNRHEALTFLNEALSMFAFALGTDHFLADRAREEIEKINSSE